MSTTRLRTAWGVAVISLLGLYIALLSFSPIHRIEIRGVLASRDIAAIKSMHGSCVSLPLGSYQAWIPAPLKRYIAAALNPIQVIAVPADGRAIVVYRGIETRFYVNRRERRWGHASYTLVNTTNGWTKPP